MSGYFVPIFFFFNYSNLPQIIFGEILFLFLWHCSSLYFLTNNHNLFHELCCMDGSGIRIKWIYLMWGEPLFPCQMFSNSRKPVFQYLFLYFNISTH